MGAVAEIEAFPGHRSYEACVCMRLHKHAAQYESQIGQVALKERTVFSEQ